MRKLLLLLLIVPYISNAQRYDNNWFYGNFISYQDSLAYPLFGNAQISFKDTFNTWAQYRGIPFSECNTSISDTGGNLLFYTNGMRILDSTSHIIENGDSLNYGDAWEHFEHDYGYPPDVYGMKLPNSLFIIPTPNVDSSYTIIHIRNDSLSGAYWSGTVCKTVVVLNPDGHFKITKKNAPISNAQAPLANISMTKHGNGRDWWIVFQERTSNCFYKYLLTPDTIQFVSVQCLGNIVSDIDYGISKFSPDGSRYLRHAYYAGLEMFDFDRCTGQLSNMFVFSSPQIDSMGDPVAVAAIPEFSPNSNLLYSVVPDDSSRWINLGQWNLNATNILSSLTVVGTSDLFIDTIAGVSHTRWNFSYPQLGFDGRLYFSGGSNRFYSYVEKPDTLGLGCNYCNRCKVLPKVSPFTISQFPNYRLGRLTGSACDTVYSDVKPIYTQTPWLKVFPNPATNDVQFDYNWIEWEKMEDLKLKIEDLQGRVVLEREVPRYSTRQNFSVKDLAAGVYTVSLCSSTPFRGLGGEHSNVIAVCKLTKLQ